MTETNYDKIKLIILRAALILLGAGIGYLALWQYFLFYPDVVGREYQIVITVVSSALITLLFWLSAKPVYRLIVSIAVAVRSLKDGVGTRGIVAVLLGLIAAAVIVVVFDVIIRMFVDIWAVRLLTDVLMYILAAALFCMGFTKWLSAERAEKSEKTADKSKDAVGYLIAAECFSDERVITAVNTLINVKVCDGAYKALCLYRDGGSEAARLMDALIKSGRLSVISGKPFENADGYSQMEKQLASSKRLKRISLAGDDGLALSVFAFPTQEMKNALFPVSEQEQVFTLAE